MTLPDGDPRSVRGSSHGRAKLTEEKVLELRRLWSLGWTCPELARKFGVCRRNVYAVLRGETWTHVSLLNPAPGDGAPALPPAAWPLPPIAPRPVVAPIETSDAPRDWRPPATEGPTVHPGRRFSSGISRHGRRPSIKTRGLRSSPQAVRAMRRLHAEGMTGKAIARRFGLSEGAVSEIVNGKVFKDLPPLSPHRPTPKEAAAGAKPLDDAEVKRLRAEGMPVSSLAIRFGVPRRLITGILQGA